MATPARESGIPLSGRVRHCFLSLVSSGETPFSMQAQSPTPQAEGCREGTVNKERIIARQAARMGKA